MSRTLSRNVVLVAVAFVGIFATSARAQEGGVRKLQDYQSVSPYDEVPTLATGFLSFTPESEIDLGFGRMYAFFGETVLWESNVYLAESDPVEDFSFNTTPGVLVDMFKGDHRFRFFYAPTVRLYLDQTVLDTVNHDADAEIRLDFVDTYVKLADTLTMTQDARNINFEGRVDSNTNVLDGEVGTLLGDFGVGVRGVWAARVYGSEVPSWQDGNEFTLGAFGRWAQHSDYSLLGDFDLMRREYRGSVLNDSTTYTVRVGIEGTPHEDLDYLVKVGFAAVRAEDNGQTGDDSDVNAMVAEGQVRLRMPYDLSGRIWYQQRPVNAAFSNYQMSYQGGVTLDKAIDPEWTWVRGLGYVEYADPSNEPSLMLYRVGLSVGANLNRWLKAELGYQWSKRLGTGTINYNAHQVYLQVVFYF